MNKNWPNIPEGAVISGATLVMNEKLGHLEDSSPRKVSPSFVVGYFCNGRFERKTFYKSGEAQGAFLDAKEFRDYLLLLEKQNKPDTQSVRDEILEERSKIDDIPARLKKPPFTASEVPPSKVSILERIENIERGAELIFGGKVEKVWLSEKDMKAIEDEVRSILDNHNISISTDRYKNIEIHKNIEIYPHTKAYFYDSHGNKSYTLSEHISMYSVKCPGQRTMFFDLHSGAEIKYQQQT